MYKPSLQVKTKCSLNWSLLLVVSLMIQTGCITTAKNTIPVSRVPLNLRGCTKDHLVSINLAALRQDPVEQYVVGPGDVISVYVPGVIPPNVEETPMIESPRTLNNEYYPPGGFVKGPSLGLPLEVGADGTLKLPLIGSIDIAGKTVPEISEDLSKRYREEGVLKSDRVQTQVNIIRQRVHRVLVIRDDSPSPRAIYKTRTQNLESDRGFADIVDLPSFENDVLHALSITGGMPGTDAHNRIWIFRNANRHDLDSNSIIYSIDEHGVEHLGNKYETTCIPLKVSPGEPLPFSEEDIKLYDGDVVYLEARDDEFFYAGGLLPAGKYRLPRDEDVDVLEAIAISAGGVGEPPKGNTGSDQVITRGSGLGNFIIPPTQLVIVRKLADGQQFRIRVDLNKATHDANERILIQPDDLLMLHFKPHEAVATVTTNFFNFSFVPPRN